MKKLTEHLYQDKVKNIQSVNVFAVAKAYYENGFIGFIRIS